MNTFVPEKQIKHNLSIYWLFAILGVSNINTSLSLKLISHVLIMGENIIFQKKSIL